MPATVVLPPLIAPVIGAPMEPMLMLPPTFTVWARMPSRLTPVIVTPAAALMVIPPTVLTARMPR